MVIRHLLTPKVRYAAKHARCPKVKDRGTVRLSRFDTPKVRKTAAVAAIAGFLAASVPVAAFAAPDTAAVSAHQLRPVVDRMQQDAVHRAKLLPVVLPKTQTPKPLLVQPKPHARTPVKAAPKPQHKAKPQHKKRPAHKVVHHKPKAVHHKKVHHVRHHKRHHLSRWARCGGAGLHLWTCQAFVLLEKYGTPPSQLDAGAVYIIAMHESAGNPTAVNNWDSNAAIGTPSGGLMQTIRPTFDAFCAPQPRCQGWSMLDPVNDIVASTRYAISKYGSLGNVPGVEAVRSGGSYVGY